MAETTKKTPAKPRKAAAKKATVTEISAHAAPSHEVAPSYEEVAKLAHQYFIDRGHRHGHHVEDWIRAEQALRGKAS